MNTIARAVALAVVFLWTALAAADGAPWSPGPGFRSAPLAVSPEGKSGFTLMAPVSTGVLFTNVLQGDALLTNSVAHNGSGVALGDVDGDGRPDIYFCSLGGTNRLFRNLGSWRFEEMSLGAAACAGQMSTGAVFADVDGDGDLDLLVNGIGAGTRLFLNNGKGQWTEVMDSGLSRTASATSMALADIDGDGDLDLYVTHYIDVMYLADPTTRLTMGTRDGRPVVATVNGEPANLPRWSNRFEVTAGGNVRELPEVDGLYRNDGNGHFTPIQFEPGTFLDPEGKPIAPYRDWGLSVMFRDVNGDGAPDLFVCNDNASPDRLWINTGKGTFRAADPMAMRHGSRSSMGVDFADINRDGRDDFIVLDMMARDRGKRMTQLGRSLPDPARREEIEERPLYNRNSLFMGRSDGTYAEAAFFAGVAATDWAWCPVFLDVDLDGYEDLLATNGFEQDVMDQDTADQFRQRKLGTAELKRYRQWFPRWASAKASFRNRRDGTFEPMAGAWGFDQQGVANGMALADLDGDGDLDLVVSNLNGAAGLYRNDTPAARIAVRLAGAAPNTAGVGAKIRLMGGQVTQGQEMISGGRYLSCDQAARVFAGLTNGTKALRLEVRWRSGNLSVVTNVEPNRVYEIAESGAAKSSFPSEKHLKPFFKDASELLGHTHRENEFDDWAGDPLLPHRLSRLGPGLCWYDFNGDGWEDLIVPAARGRKLAVYASEGGRKFDFLEGGEAAPADQTAAVGWSDGKGNRNFLIAVSNAETPDRESQIESFSSSVPPKSLPAGLDSIGPLAMADIDGDGDLDLFVGGRARPGRFAAPASSAVWLNENGELRPNSAWSEPFRSVGMVSGATFCDLDGDGHPDLVLAVEWGPVRVFRNNNGRFEEVTKAWGFGERTGLWSGVVAGDFNGDGKMDLAVGNWGRNSAYQMAGPGPLRLYRGGAADDPRALLIEAAPQDGKWFPLRNRNWYSAAMPDLAQRFPTHQAFSQATVEDILGAGNQGAPFLEVTELRSGVFLNRGSRFEWVPFPAEAQLAPVFGINVGDYDGDGVEDVFLSQNCFGAPSDYSRDDGGRGLWLNGNGNGTFSAVDADVTGIRVYGEQRGAALADFDHDGRIDLAVAQNNSQTKLYLNQKARPGIRVTLRGRGGNPDGIGAQIRMVYRNGRLGPARAVQAGSGYWSNDSSIHVLSLGPNAVAVRVRWASGKEQTTPLLPNSGTLPVEIKEEGQ